MRPDGKGPPDAIDDAFHALDLLRVGPHLVPDPPHILWLSGLTARTAAQDCPRYGHDGALTGRCPIFGAICMFPPRSNAVPRIGADWKVASRYVSMGRRNRSQAGGDWLIFRPVS